MSDERENPYLQEVNGRKVVTAAGRQRLAPVITDTTGNVYAFTGNDLNPQVIAAAMARLSRRGDDMRVTLLDEFVDMEGKAEDLLARVVTQYGDDSVQQLDGISLVFEDASNLLTKHLERGRLAAYLEQSTRYIYFDKQDEQGRYRYHTPAGLTPHLATVYRTHMDMIFQSYSSIVWKLTGYVREKHPQGDENKAAWLASTRAEACDAARALLPAATTSTVGIFASAQALEALIMRLLSEPLPEAVEAGQKLLKAANQVAPVFFQRADNPKYGGATTAYRGTNRQNLRRLAKHLVGTGNESLEADTVRLVRYWLPNDIQMTAEMLFEHCDLSLAELEERAANLTAEERQLVFNTYVGERLNRRHKPGRAFELPLSEWEVTADYGSFRDLQRHRLVDAMEWQRLTVEYGYEVPALVIEAGLEEEFRACFRRSAGLYDLLVEAGYETEAQYATLLGHRMRYRFAMNLRQAFHFIELRTQPAGHAGYRRICQRMYELLVQVYPQIAEAMKFVNQDENPALTRLAAERATQFKLARLDSLDRPRQ